MTRSGWISLGRFLRCPMAHAHVAPAIAKESVEFAVVDFGGDELADEEDVIAGRLRGHDPAPEHRDAARDRGRDALRVHSRGDPERRELVRSWRRLSRGRREVLLRVMEDRDAELARGLDE